jgi:hypothetical protein
MKTLQAILFCFGGLILMNATAQAAEASPTLYVAVDYMRVADGRSKADYIALEQLWQRLHQKAADAGICRGWYFDRVENGGRNQFVTVRVYDSLEKLAAPWPDSLVQGLFNEEEMKKINQTGEFRALTRTELWQLEGSAMKSTNNPSSLSAHIVVDYMKPKPGKGQEYYAMESGPVQRVHEARIKTGKLDSWFFLSRMFPSGTDSEFDFVTVNIFKDKAAAEAGWDPAVMQSALTPDELAKVPNFNEVRSIVREEIWHPLLMAEPKLK